jgi:hypothetical protein
VKPCPECEARLLTAISIPSGIVGPGSIYKTKQNSTHYADVVKR